jgi:hypothetical protein
LLKANVVLSGFKINFLIFKLKVWPIWIDLKIKLKTTLDKHCKTAETASKMHSWPQGRDLSILVFKHKIELEANEWCSSSRIESVCQPTLYASFWKPVEQSCSIYGHFLKMCFCSNNFLLAHFHDLTYLHFKKQSRSKWKMDYTL